LDSTNDITYNIFDMMDLVFILVGIVMIILAYYGMKGTGL